jgi:hypothetical protein
MKRPRQKAKKAKALDATKDLILKAQQNTVLKRLMQALLPEILVGPKEESPPAWVIRLGKKMNVAFGIQDPQATDPEAQGKIAAVLQALPCFLGSADPNHLPSGFRKGKMKPFQRVTQTLAKEALAKATRMPGESQAKFFGGYSESINGTIEASGLPAHRTERFLLDLALLGLWAQERRFKNSKELYLALSGPSGTDNAWLGDLASFQRYLRKMGVSYGTRGRQTK